MSEAQTETSIERHKNALPSPGTVNPGAASLEASQLALSDHPVPEDGKAIKLDVAKIASDVTRSLIPSLSALGLGGTVVLFDPSSRVPLSYASTEGDPQKFIFTLSRLLEGREGMHPIEEESAQSTTSGEIDFPEGAGKPVSPSRTNKVLVGVVWALLFLIAFLLSGCSSLHFGAKAPTDKTYRISEADIALAASDDCKQDWVSGNPAVDVLSAKRILREKGIETVEGNPIAAATSLADDPKIKLGLLVVKPGFWETPEDYQAEYLSHELVHYCDLERLGADYEISFATSNGRWALETRAYAQSFRTKAAQGMRKMDLREAIDSRLEAMRNYYWLWDLDPDQYLAETKDIWLEAAGL